MEFLKITFMVLFLLVTVIGMAGADQRLEQSRRDLKELQQQIEETSETLKERRQTARRLADQLAAVNRELRLARRKVADLEEKVRGLQVEIDQREKEVANGQVRINALRKEVRKRLIALYKGGDAQLVKILFSARPVADCRYRSVYSLPGWRR